MIGVNVELARKQHHEAAGMANAAGDATGIIAGPMQENEADREARLRELASKLFFTLKNQGFRFALYRDVDVPEPVRHDGLTLDEVETYSMHGNFVARTAADVWRSMARHQVAARPDPVRRRMRPMLERLPLRQQT